MKFFWSYIFISLGALHSQNIVEENGKFYEDGRLFTGKIVEYRDNIIRKEILITKGQIDDCSTSWAQGGIASVISKSDSFKKHLDDTIENGHGIVEEHIASEIIKEGPSCIDWLSNMGVPFTKDENKVFRESGNIQSSIVFGRYCSTHKKSVFIQTYFVIVLSGSKAIQYSTGSFVCLKCEIDFEDTATS